MSEQQVIVMAIGNERYGVDVKQVQSIEKIMPITRVPRTLPFIKGVMNLRGVVTPVIDLRERFHFPVTDLTDDARITVVQVADMTVGMIVDAVIDVATLSTDEIDTPPAIVGGIQAIYLSGVARVKDELLILLNLERVLSNIEEQQLKEVEKSVLG
jgi:purine-binding chemotaxis protein CheW